MSDIVEKLRTFEGSDALGNGDFSVCKEADDEILRLRAVLAEANGLLKDAQEPLSDLFYCENRTCLSCRIHDFLYQQEQHK
jgi:hypothetical protein